ncbi:MAG TPA: hypothetical protein VFU03_09325 [Gemmatimonadales bacterium]|nr:hypothetical protein [Gemmatimonadales bacterium]
MNHLDVEQVERLLDGEMVTTADRWARVHVTDCGECRERLAVAEREAAEIRSLLTQADHESPKVDALQVAARARVRRGGWQKWAAGILLVLGSTGILYAAPGSPLRGWLAAAARWISHEEVKAPAEESAPAPASVAGIAVTPGASLVILFEASQPEGRARITLSPGTEVIVRAPAGSATFSTQASRLVIGNHGPASTYEIEIPLKAPRVEVLVEGGRIFLKEGQDITVTDSSAGTGPYLLPLTGRKP